jgi:CRP-like cAMP-binding protein
VVAIRQPTVLTVNVVDLLRQVDVFASLPQEALTKIASLATVRMAATDEVIYRRGDAAEAIYVVADGRVRVDDTDLGQGELFGALGLLSGEPRPATATVVEDSRILVLDRAACEEIMSAYPQVLRNSLQVVSQRALQANRKLLADDSSTVDTRAARGRVYAVFSPRGGSGKTTVAVNLALRLAHKQRDRVAIVDLDLLFGEVAPRLGTYPTAALGSVAAADLAVFERRELLRHLAVHASGLQVLRGAMRPDEGENVTAAHVRAALGALKRQVSTIVVDCTSSFSESTLTGLEMADRIIVLCTPELTTLRDIRDCQRIFDRALHVDKDRVWYAFSHPSPSSGLTRVQFESALDEPMAFEIPHAGEQPTALGKSPFARAIDEMARRIEAEIVDTRPTPPTAAPAPGGIGRAVAGANRVFGLLRHRSH